MTTPAALRRLEADLGEVIASRDRRDRRKRDFAQYADDPVGFWRDVLKGNPWSAQVDFAEAVRDNPLVVVRSCNSAGKDHAAAHLALWWAYAVGGLVLLTGPTERQVSEILMRKEVARAFNAGGLDGQLYATALRREGAPEAGILAMTSTEAGRLTGFHDARVLAVITEAQDVDEFAWDALMACATGADDRILAVGNPMRPLGRFFAVSRPSSQWVKFKISALDHPNVVEGRDVIPGGVTQAWVNRQRREWGSDSPQFIARVLGEFPETAEDALVARAWLEAAAERHESGAMEDEAIASGWMAGLDVARFGDDSTTLALRRGPVLKSIESWNGADTMTTTGRVIEALHARNLRPRREPNPLFASPEVEYGPGIITTDLLILVDMIGLGSGVLDRLVEQGWPAEGIHGAAKPRNPERFLNRRAEIYWNLRTRLEEGTIALPRDEHLFEELLATRYLIASSGKIQIESKKELRARLGRSPDLADALAYAFGVDGYASGLTAGIDL